MFIKPTICNDALLGGAIVQMYGNGGIHSRKSFAQVKNMLDRIKGRDIAPLTGDQNLVKLIAAMKDWLVGNVKLGSNGPERINSADVNPSIILGTNETDVLMNFLQGDIQAGGLDGNFRKYCKTLGVVCDITIEQSNLFRDLLNYRKSFLADVDHDKNALKIIAWDTVLSKACSGKQTKPMLENQLSCIDEMSESSDDSSIRLSSNNQSQRVMDRHREALPASSQYQTLLRSEQGSELKSEASKPSEYIDKLINKNTRNEECRKRPKLTFLSLEEEKWSQDDVERYMKSVNGWPIDAFKKLPSEIFEELRSSPLGLRSIPNNLIRDVWKVINERFVSDFFNQLRGDAKLKEDITAKILQDYGDKKINIKKLLGGGDYIIPSEDVVQDFMRANSESQMKDVLNEVLKNLNIGFFKRKILLLSVNLDPRDLKEELVKFTSRVAEKYRYSLSNPR